MEDSPKNLSRHQYGDLLFIHRNRVTMATLRKANMITMTSLAARGYLRRVGTGEDTEIMLTPAGEMALKTYTDATMYERKAESDITERCARLLRHSRRIVEMGERKVG